MILNGGMPTRKDTGNNSLLLLTSIRDSVTEIQRFYPSGKGEIKIFLFRIVSYVSECAQSRKTQESLEKDREGSRVSSRWSAMAFV